jgi:DUF2934 family protein
MTQLAIRMVVPPKVQSIQSPGELHEQVRLRAYELYEARGREDGHEVGDWLQAEWEVAMQQSKALAA